MHDRYGKDGLEVISVITDDPKDAKSSANARKFLAEKLKAKFRSVQVDISTFDYEKKISSENVPAAFVFNRDNLWVKKLPSFDDKGKLKEEVGDGELDEKGELKLGEKYHNYGLIEKTVRDLLKK